MLIVVQRCQYVACLNMEGRHHMNIVILVLLCSRTHLSNRSMVANHILMPPSLYPPHQQDAMTVVFLFINLFELMSGNTSRVGSIVGLSWFRQNKKGSDIAQLLTQQPL